MADTTPGGSNGEQVRTEAQKARDHLKAAGAAAAEAVRENVSAAADSARAGARDATDWARSRITDLKGRIERQPQSAALWALGIGVVAGFLLATIVRPRRD